MGLDGRPNTLRHTTGVSLTFLSQWRLYIFAPNSRQQEKCSTQATVSPVSAHPGDNGILVIASQRDAKPAAPAALDHARGGAHELTVVPRARTAGGQPRNVSTPDLHPVSKESLHAEICDQGILRICYCRVRRAVGRCFNAECGAGHKQHCRRSHFGWLRQTRAHGKNAHMHAGDRWTQRAIALTKRY